MKKAIVILLCLLSLTVHAEEKFRGILVSSPSDVLELPNPYFNGYGFSWIPGNIKQYMDVRQYNHEYVIIATNEGFNEQYGIELINEMHRTLPRDTDVMIMLDEILLPAVKRCVIENTGCEWDDIYREHKRVLSMFDMFATAVKSAFPNVKIIHNEAGVVLSYYADRNMPIDLMSAADIYSMDCYGSFSACGDIEYGKAYSVPYYYNMIKSFIVPLNNDGNDRKIMLVPGAALVSHLTDEYAVISQIIGHASMWDDPMVIGFGAFLWSDAEGFMGLKNLPMVRSFIGI